VSNVTSNTEYRTSCLDSLRHELFFHQERRKMVETNPELTAEDLVEQLEYHDRLVMRVLGELINLEGH